MNLWPLLVKSFFCEPTPAAVFFCGMSLQLKIISYELSATPREWRALWREEIVSVQGGHSGEVRTVEGEGCCYLVKIWGVFTGVNGLCHHYATTVQCWLVAALSGSYFISTFWTKPGGEREHGLKNRAVVNKLAANNDFLWSAYYLNQSIYMSYKCH